MDGYFNGGTAPWFIKSSQASLIHSQAHPIPVNHNNPPCQWGQKIANAYLPGCAQNCKGFPTLSLAQSNCSADSTCAGVTYNPSSLAFELRSTLSPAASSSGEYSFVIANEYECHRMPANSVWKEIGTAAYMGLNRTDPDAIWYFFQTKEQNIGVIRGLSRDTNDKAGG